MIILIYNVSQGLKLDKVLCQSLLLCLTLCDPIDQHLQDSSIHGILQARILEQVAIPFLRGFPNLGMEPRSPALQPDLNHLSCQASLPKWTVNTVTFFLIQLKPSAHHHIFSGKQQSVDASIYLKYQHSFTSNLTYRNLSLTVIGEVVKDLCTEKTAAIVKVMMEEI